MVLSDYNDSVISQHRVGRVRGDRLRSRRIAGRFDGTRTVLLQASDGVWERFLFDRLPESTDDGYYQGGYWMVTRDDRSLGVNSTPYRIQTMPPEGWTGKRPPTHSFVLSGNHTNETLFVIAEHLRHNNVPFIALANRHGNAFKHAGLSGTYLAYYCSA